METNYPNNLYAYYAGQPDKFELRTDRTKKMLNFALAAVCLALVIFPQIVPIGNLLVRIIAIVGLLYFGVRRQRLVQQTQRRQDRGAGCQKIRDA